MLRRNEIFAPTFFLISCKTSSGMMFERSFTSSTNRSEGSSSFFSSYFIRENTKCSGGREGSEKYISELRGGTMENELREEVKSA